MVANAVFLDRRFIPAYAGNSNRAWHGLRLLSVHPRLREELIACRLGGVLCHGSSPLTRGTPWKIQGGGLQGRFIPAYAGNSLRMSKVRSIRGGSSPLTRGTPYSVGQSWVLRAVHPRLRGELSTLILF